MKYFGRVLMIIREEYGLTQAHLAESINKSPQYINDLEKGHRAPCGIETMVKIASLFEDDVEVYARLSKARALETGTITLATMVLKDKELDALVKRDARRKMKDRA